MPERPLAVQVCCVCNRRFANKTDLGDHTSNYHGVNWHPAVLKRADDQLEFVPKRPTRKPPNTVAWPVKFGE